MLGIQEFEKEVKQGLPRFINFCFSSEYFFLSEAARLIRKNFESLIIETYENPEDIDINSLINTNPLFSSKRILLIYNFEKITKKDRKISWLNRISKAQSPLISLVILCNSSLKEITDEINFIKQQKNSALFNLDVSEKDLFSWINYKASQVGINLKTDAISYIISITGGQPGLISSEIEKIALLSSRTELGLFDIKDILSELGEFSAFDLVDAVRKGDKKRAFALLDKIKFIEPDLILGALNYYYSTQAEADEKVFSSLYRANLSLRQGRLCSIEILLNELFKN